MRCAALLLAILLSRSAAAEPLNLPGLLKNGALRVESESGRELLGYRDEDLLVPASILKVATAFCALEELGRSYRYETEIWGDTSGTLYVRGSGDPMMVSEELASIAAQLASKRSRIDAIVIDPSLFDPAIDIDGASPSRNPYDAKNAAFVGNFSAVALSRKKDGSVASAEPQTPLTPMSKRLGQTLRRGTTERIKVGDTWQAGSLYGGELLSEFLSTAGAIGKRTVRLGSTPKGAMLVLRHTSSRSLEEVVRGMLEHSTNFTANQIFLTLGVKKFGPPATVAKAQRAMSECLTQKVGWRGFHVEEGSGLSRRNQVSAHLMTKLLKSFEPYRDLLPIKEGYQAKTGSLNGVNSLAGYLELPNASRARFAIIINSYVPHSYKFTVADRIRDYIKNRSDSIK